MKQLIKHILKESAKEKFINTIVNKIKSGVIKAPYFKNLDKFEVSKAERKEIFEKFFGGHVTIKQGTVFDSVGDQIYYENSNGYWRKWKYDDSRNKIYREDNNWSYRFFP